ncbi:glycoside hydrolase family protein [Halosimplex halophilum]|uniref:hypothetical protein n=1 Tax=Halosimplex halophilum TaxID=2559572 RepID=UPI00107FCF96|nr:hypothetical protein [Halosimplex halophilum]
MPSARQAALAVLALSALLVAGAVAVGLSWGTDSVRRGGIPDRVSDAPVNASAISVEFTRTDNSTMLRYNSHDAVVFDDSADAYHLLVHNSNRRRILLRSVEPELPTNASGWEPVELTVNGRNPGGSIDTAVEVNGTYYAYQDGQVYTSTTLAAEKWTHRSDSPPGQDHGVYYDTATGRFHLFYEAGDREDHSGLAIGHATSPNGVTDWTVRPPVYNTSGRYKVGDFEVVEQDGVYFMFGDYTTDHPQYSVSVWANDDLYTNFTRVDTVMAPSGNDSATLDGYGIQDADVVRVGSDGRYVMFAHGHTGETGPRYLHTFTGRIRVGERALASNDTTSAPNGTDDASGTDQPHDARRPGTRIDGGPGDRPA